MTIFLNYLKFPRIFFQFYERFPNIGVSYIKWVKPQSKLTEDVRMKKRIFCLALALVLCLSVTATSLATTAPPITAISPISTRQASGGSYMSVSGRTVTFSGYSTSAQTEDIIRITVILWEQRGSVWYAVARASNEAPNASFVSVLSSFTVGGGRYYKVTGTHYSKKNGVSYSVTSETSTQWIP